MLCINDHHTDPYFNLAAEEYMLKNFTDNCFMLWRNGPSVIVGCHQNSLAEINMDFIRRNNIKVVRRLTGGGAVFHDLGNINFTFIENAQNDKLIDFQKYTQPIISVLQLLDVDARFEGRNDLVIDGKKFSGNAEHMFRNRVLHHGTLLFASKLTDLSGALNVNPAKFTDKAIKSVSSRVTNISSHLKKPLDMEEFRDMVLRYMMDNYPDCTPYEYTDADIAAISKLRDGKYATWDWNFGKSPGYNMVNGIKTNGGYLEVHLDVQNGIISHVRIFGDFFNVRDTAELEQLLTGTPHNETSVRQKLEQISLSDYLVNVTVDELVKVMILYGQ
ncbi:MAG: lipoate--protein ligase [Bacteroidales bacterium]|jgi:lipoate-protein ligase A|nr:lipoate--protein ligase [Bacteroidales bacterium]